MIVRNPQFPSRPVTSESDASGPPATAMSVVSHLLRENPYLCIGAGVATGVLVGWLKKRM